MFIRGSRGGGRIPRESVLGDEAVIQSIAHEVNNSIHVPMEEKRLAK